MKKLFALLLALSLCFVLFGCDNEDEKIEVTYLGGAVLLSYYDINDEYYIFHGLKLDSTSMTSLNEIVGYTKKDTAHLSTKILTNSRPLDVAWRTTMRKCVHLSKNDILLILRNHELPGLGTEDLGVLTLKKFPDFD